MPLTIAECPASSLAGIQARLLIAGIDEPCKLSATIEAGSLKTGGDCPGVPERLGTCGGSEACTALTDPDACLASAGCKWELGMALEWFVVSPATKADILLASMNVRASLYKQITNYQDPTLIEFEKLPAQFLKTSTKPGDAASEVARFNADADNCSNLEELCQATLFLSQFNTCSR